MPRAERISEVRTEHLLTELLSAQGWNTSRPPKGELLRQHEYKDHAHLLDIFRSRSKRGGAGDGLPEAVVVDRATLQPQIVIEAKANKGDLEKAVREVTRGYGRACIDAGYNPLAVAVAGTSEDEFAVRVYKWNGSSWRAVTYEANPIEWIPNRADTERLRSSQASPELRPTPPSTEALAEQADEINRLLRESSINDRDRPAVVGACMLALWQSKGELRKAPEYILADINQACGQAFWNAQKPILAKSLTVDEANQTLAIKARRIINILERLNVPVLTAEHDYLGQLYETFFRYAGGNTIGQYFTPRHVAAFCADLIEVTQNDVVLDPACGTGGFLIAAMSRIQREHKLSRTQMVKIVQKKLIGFDSEPVTAALCVANMILRGDGSSSVHRGDAFTADEFPVGGASAVLMNPPYPHKKTDAPPERFVERSLEGLSHGGRLAVIVPLSLLVKSDKKKWRQSIIEKHTVEAAIKLPDELFQPYAQPYTVVLYLRKGVPHPKDKPVFFARIENDGYRLKKGVRVPCDGSEMPGVLAAFQSHGSKPGFFGWSVLDNDVSFAPGAYIPARILSDEEVNDGVLEIVRSRTAFVAYFAPNIIRINDENATPLSAIRRKSARKVEPGTVGAYFDIYYGQKALHSKENLRPGRTLVISSSRMHNGCYGFFDFEQPLAPPFVTVPSTGSIAIAHVQELACGVTDDCLILLPKPDVPHAVLYIAAAVIRNEAWRFSYGRKATPDRIANFPVPVSDDMVALVEGYLKRAAVVEKTLLKNAEEALDASIAVSRLRQIETGDLDVVEGADLDARLAVLESE